MVHIAPALVITGITRVESDGFREVGDGPVATACGIARQVPVVVFGRRRFEKIGTGSGAVRIGVLWIEPNGFCVIGNRLGGALATLNEAKARIASEFVCPGILWIEPDGFSAIDNRAGEVVAVLVGFPSLAVRLHKFWVEPDRLRVVCDGLIVFELVAARFAEFIEFLGACPVGELDNILQPAGHQRVARAEGERLAVTNGDAS